MSLHFGRATKILAQTLPYVLLRIGVGIAFGLFTVLYFGAVAAAVYFAGDIGTLIVLGIFVLSFGVFLMILRFLRKYVLYLVAAGHIATIAHIVDTGDVPDNQIRFGKDKVTDNFASASALFVVDKVIKSVLKQFNSAVISLSSLVDFVPALKNIITVLRKAVTLAGRHLDQAILAHIFLHDDKDNWTAARDGLVLYAKTWKPVLTAAVIIVLAMYLVIALSAIVASPIGVVLGGLNPFLELAGWAVVLGVVATFYFGIIGPWVKTIIITTFLIESQDKTPDSETMDFLESKASNFREVVENAAEESSSSTTETPTAGGGADPTTDD